MLSFIKTLLLISTLCFADGRVLAGHRKQVYSSLRGEVQARRLGANSVQMEQKERQAQSREAQQRQSQERQSQERQSQERQSQERQALSREHSEPIRKPKKKRGVRFAAVGEEDLVLFDPGDSPALTMKSFRPFSIYPTYEDFEVKAEKTVRDVKLELELDEPDFGLDNVPHRTFNGTQEQREYEERLMEEMLESYFLDNSKKGVIKDPFSYALVFFVGDRYFRELKTAFATKEEHWAAIERVTEKIHNKYKSSPLHTTDIGELLNDKNAVNLEAGVKEHYMDVGIGSPRRIDILQQIDDGMTRKRSITLNRLHRRDTARVEEDIEYAVGKASKKAKKKAIGANLGKKKKKLAIKKASAKARQKVIDAGLTDEELVRKALAKAGDKAKVKASTAGGSEEAIREAVEKAITKAADKAGVSESNREEIGRKALNEVLNLVEGEMEQEKLNELAAKQVDKMKSRQNEKGRQG
eukprot:GHVH01009970.1.p1 GENE.GHVH01009970.1~~GHVH01009970.1.p1  ORF type:complete len:526 (+),score=66.99 GHVH01009970.1:174-1580(+)